MHRSYNQTVRFFLLALEDLLVAEAALSTSLFVITDAAGAKAILF